MLSESYDNPGAIRHLRKSTLADVLSLERRARAGEEAARPKPPATDSPTFGSYIGIRRRSRQTSGTSNPLDKPARQSGGWPAGVHIVHVALLPPRRRGRRPDALGVGRSSSAMAATTSGVSVPSATAMG